MNERTKWNKPADKATTLAAGREFLATTIIMGLALAGLAYFDVAEGWRVPVILAISTVWLGVGIAVAQQAIREQIWLAALMTRDE